MAGHVCTSYAQNTVQDIVVGCTDSETMYYHLGISGTALDCIVNTDERSSNRWLD